MPERAAFPWAGAAVAALIVAGAAGVAGAQVRAIEGTDNNPSHPEWGAINQWLGRLTPPAYADGISAPAGASRPSPRAISQIVSDQEQPVFSRRVLTSMLFQWGQVLDHDLTLSHESSPPEWFNIAVPSGDPWFDPTGAGGVEMPFRRSEFDVATGTDPTNPRQQFNAITAWIDASMVYGVDRIRAAWLRTREGGRMKTSGGNLPPFNTVGFPNANPLRVPDASLFIAGDVRCNEQPALLCMHTLLLREHNRLADEISAANPTWSDEQIYQKARLLVGSLVQKITFDEFLVALVGADRIPPYAGYDPAVNPDIAAAFSGAAFRVGHTMINPFIARLGPDGRPIPAGPLPLRDGFFQPQVVIQDGIDPILRGIVQQLAQEIDIMVIDDLRNFLFGAPGAGGLDLAALNIQRGRDHGLGSYNDVRAALGMKRMTTFDEMISNPEVRRRLAEAYDDIDDVDLWVGGLAEDHLPGASMGETFTAIILDQLTRVRDGDRFWYQNILGPDDLAWVESQRLSDIIRRNTGVQFIQPNVFFVSADFNRDGQLDFLDFLAFQSAFGLGDPDADMDFDGELTFFDFLAFQNAFGQHQ